MRKIIAGALCGVLAIAAFSPKQVHAQNENIGNRSRAIDDCSADPNYRGYETFEICVEETYKEYQTPGYQTDRNPRPGNNDPFDDFNNCASSRIPEKCHG